MTTSHSDLLWPKYHKNYSGNTHAIKYTQKRIQKELSKLGMDASNINYKHMKYDHENYSEYFIYLEVYFDLPEKRNLNIKIPPTKFQVNKYTVINSLNIGENFLSDTNHVLKILEYSDGVVLVVVDDYHFVLKKFSERTHYYNVQAGGFEIIEILVDEEKKYIFDYEKDYECLLFDSVVVDHK